MNKTIAGTIGATAAASVIAGAILLGNGVSAPMAPDKGITIDAFISIESSRAGTTIRYAKWKLIAETAALYAAFDVYSQNYEATGPAKFLLADDAELASVKAKLDEVGISYEEEINVALTARQKQLAGSMRIASRSDLPAALERLERLDATTTFAEWKTESLKSSGRSPR